MAKPGLNALPSVDHSIPSSDGNSQLFIRQYGIEKPRIHFLLVHGALEHSGRHSDLIHYILKNFGREVAITTWDHIGHGRSGGVRAFVPSFKVYVDDMNLVGDFMTTRNDEHTVNFILAHSLGGLISLTRILDTNYGWKYPIKGIIFSSPCIRAKMTFGASSQTLLEKLNRLSGKIHLPLIYTGKDLSHDPERANDFDSDTLIPRFITAGMAKEIIEATNRVRGLSYYMQTPCLFLIAGKDHIVDSESTFLFARGMDKRLTTIVHYPEAYHELWNEIDRFEIFETMKKWIEKTLKEKV